MALTKAMIDDMRRYGVPENDISRAIQQSKTTAEPAKPATTLPAGAAPKTSTGTASTKTTSGYSLPSGVSDVFALQRDLNAKGANIAVDGVYGPKTDAAYKTYFSGTSPATGTTVAANPAPNATPAAAPTGSLTSGAAKKPTVPTGVDIYGMLGYKPKEYKSDLYDRALALIEDAQDDTFSYDPNQDEAYQQYVEKATEAGAKAYSSAQGSRNRNGLISSSVADTIAQNAQNRYTSSAKEAVVDFRDKAMNDFRTAQNDKLTQAKSLLGLDETNYNRFQDQEQAAQDARSQYVKDTGYYPVDISAIPEDSWVWTIDDDYDGGYRAYIDDLKKTDPESDLIPILEAVRNEKIRLNPELNGKYGDTMVYTPGIKTASTRQAEAEAAAQAEADAAALLATPTTRTSSGTRSSGTSASNAAPATQAEDMNLLLDGMLDSGDPVGWYSQNLPYLTEDQKKYLKTYALDKYSDPVKMMDTAPNGTRYLFRYYVDGETAYDMNNPTGFATKNKYANDPQAALNDIQSSTSARKALGSLYEYTVSMLKSKVASAKTQEPAETGDSNVQTAVAAIKSSADPYAMFAGWSRQVKEQAGYAQLLAALKSATGAKFSQERLQAALQWPTSR